ncbi:Tvs1p ASCRUDRAFT_39216 [Ascoidea rubescens DSM 1968]|uniref:Protein YTP1-like C-terminal domain-containing protein n=1 Tax=Ascoidea rubescens DSM 1968 TaxID=1344418 RepID=A0A1D2VA13_9ASCO|nr:hypothetical protein ASCRUDRAFT_39216 [Ascoidea rubescens DSM 1968]ODV58516.1 hypothetical protein ASCRUDRAFT_39216 [Ascoidea rubescens DSM 1968]
MSGEMQSNTNAYQYDLSTMNLSLLTPTPHIPKQHHGVPILETDLLPEERLFWQAYNTTTFFTYPSNSSNKFFLYSHVSLLSISVLFLYPASLVLNNVNSIWYLPVLSLNLISILSSLTSLSIFANSIDEALYPNNAYNKMSWILLFMVIVHYFSALVSKTKQKFNYYFTNNSISSQNPSFIPLHDYRSSISSDFQNQQFPDLDQDTLFDRSNHPSFDDSKKNSSGNYYYNPRKSSLVYKFFHSKFIHFLIANLGNACVLIFNLLNYSILFYFLCYIPTGIAVGNLLGKANKVFNLLAHFIKGGVFFSFGMLTLCRYCGCWKDSAFAWNFLILSNFDKSNSKWWFIRHSPKGLITMEFVESFLIFFYGITNIFLEHLASPGGPWVAKDLQHVSIAFMYIGSGLCGLIVEFSLSNWRYNKAIKDTSNDNPDSNQNHIVAASPGYSPNPFPVFTIFWTGILMSQHAQASELSTTIHMQWGYMLSYGSLFRLFTILILLFQKDNDSFKKIGEVRRPMTELITSFALLTGGLIFMESTDQIVHALEYRGLTAMFTLNVSVGCVALLMSWIMLLCFWRDWLKKKKHLV